MHADKQGIHLTRSEAWTLLAFTGSGDRHAVVHFRVAANKMAAASSDGRCSVHVTAKADKGAKKGKWVITRECLELARSSMSESEHTLILDLTQADKHPVAIIADAESGKAVQAARYEHACVEDAQLTLDEISEGIQTPDDKGYRGSWCAFDPVALHPLNRLRVAVEKQPITMYPPANDHEPLRFEVIAEKGRWVCSILTERVLGPGEERDEPPEDEDAGRPDRQRALDLEDKANGKQPPALEMKPGGKGKAAKFEPDDIDGEGDQL